MTAVGASKGWRLRGARGNERIAHRRRPAGGPAAGRLCGTGRAWPRDGRRGWPAPSHGRPARTGGPAGPAAHAGRRDLYVRYLRAPAGDGPRGGLRDLFGAAAAGPLPRFRALLTTLAGDRHRPPYRPCQDHLRRPPGLSPVGLTSVTGTRYGPSPVGLERISLKPGVLTAS